MLEIGAFEAKNTLGSLLDRVEDGEEIIITRHGRRVARIVPNAEGVDRSEARQAMDRIRKRAAKLKLARFDWREFKVEREAGRP